MTSSIDDKEKSDPSSPKHQKMTEEETIWYDSDSDDSECGTPEEIQLFYDEWDKSQGFDMDFSKLTYCSSWKQLDLDDSTMVDEPETNREFIATLANLALTKHNAEYQTSLELGKILLRANFYLAAGPVFHISFEVNDPSDDNQTIPCRAVVRYVASCFPRPTS
uniref:Cystatin domain-containing protein n=1 Tax=Noccaea caerulescens TaxID=107243 RepID=A0A1J3K223_NOCCA